MTTEPRNQLVGKKILFATAPADGHMNPLTGLAKYLQAAGCDVRWYTSAIYAAKLQRLSIPHYCFERAWDINLGNLDAQLPERQTIMDPAARMDFDLIHFFGNRAPEYYADIQHIHQSFSFDVLVADNLFSAIPLVKHGMRIPVVVIGVLPLPQDSIDLAPYGAGLPPASTEATRTQYAQMRTFTANVLFKASIEAYSAILHAQGIAHEPAPLFHLLVAQASLYLQIGTPSLEYKRSDLSDNVRFVGALLPYAPPVTQQPWFDERVRRYKQVVLVTQGTVESDTQKLLAPTLEAFQNSDSLVIATTGGNGTTALRSQFPAKNIIIEDYIPFTEVMPYATVFVTNGGYGGVLLGLQHGLLIVAAGVHEVKNEVCARVANLGYGIDLHTETPSAHTIREAVAELVANDHYATNVAHLAEELTGSNAYEISAQYIAELLSS